MTALTHVLRVRRTIAAPRERVFRAWTEPARVCRWWAPEGCEIPIAELDPKVGGRYRIRMAAPDGSHYTVGGVFRVVQPPAKLVFTWWWEPGAASGMIDDGDRVESIVTVEFVEDGDRTEVVITHELPSAKSREGHTQGWESCLNRLEATVGIVNGT